MSKRILLIQAHPDASQPHLCHALASSYAKGAESEGHIWLYRLRVFRVEEDK